jgi:FkbM family methyltransferase
MTEVEVQTPWGARLTVLAEDASHRGDFLATGVNWEHETRILRQLVRPGMTVVDVGANFGYCASLFAAGCGSHGRVLAIEPEPVMFGLLARNAADGHGNVTTLNAAVGAADGAARLWRSATNLGCHSLSRQLVPTVASSVTVPLTRLDTVCVADSPFGQVDLLKVDVEGWEAAVLQSGDELLRRCKPALWLEFWPDGLRQCGTPPESLLRDIAGWGYTITMVDLLTGAQMAADGSAPIDYCDQMTENLRAEGNLDLYGIVYLLARQA